MQRFAAALILALPLPAACGALLFLQAPPAEVLSDSAVTLSLAPAPGTSAALDSCGVYTAPVSLGATLGGRLALSEVVDAAVAQPPSLQLTFTPAAGAQLSLGVHYVIAACQDGAALSPEFPLRVVTAAAPVILTPQTQDVSARPEISWTPVPGVPAYHLLLSDQPLHIDAQAGTVSGASIIWQAIVSGDHILYGDPDPSGNFSQIEAPPLSAGVPYNLAILNNYDGVNPLNTSTRAEALKFFTYSAAGSALSPPRWLAPAAGTAFAAPRDSLLTFRWTSSSAAGQNANTYQIYVYASASENGIAILRPVWQTETTDTTATFAPAGVLLPGNYVDKVFALSSGSAAGSVSDTSFFSYAAAVQTLQLGARTVAASGDTMRLANVRVTVAALDGSNSSLPLYTLASGWLSTDFALGQYRATFAADGYPSVVLNVSLTGGAAVTLDPVLAAARCRVTGSVADASGPLGNATVTAIGADGSPVTAHSDALGNFLLGLAPGPLRLAFTQDDYDETDTALTVAEGQSVNLGMVTLHPSAASLSGLVRTPAGVPIVAAEVDLEDTTGAALRSLTTDGQGLFNLFMPRGVYRVAASRTGYASATQTVSLTAAANLVFNLTPGASVINVHVTQITKLPNGDSIAADLPGATVSLRSVSGGAANSGLTDANGAAALSAADTGWYWLSGSQAQTYADSVQVHVALAPSTVTGRLSLLRYASVSGRLRLWPDTTVDPARLQISLLPTGTGAAITGSPVAAAPADSLGRFAFDLGHVAAGTYTVTCGLPGYAPDSEPVIAVARGLGPDTLQLTLRITTSQAAFQFRRGAAILPGTVRLRSPFPSTFAADQKQTLGAGAYLLDAEPQDTTALPLRAYSVLVSGPGPFDTTVALPFPAWRDSGALMQGGRVLVPYHLDTAADAGSVAYAAAAGKWDTLVLASSQLRAGMDTAVFPAPPQGGWLQYALDLRFGNRDYGQGATGAPYRIAAPRDTALAVLTVAEGDSLLLPDGADGRITVHAWSAAGDELDAGVLRTGTVTARLSAGFSGSLSSWQGLSGTVHAAVPVPKPGAVAATGWDSLYVTVTYANHRASLPVLLRGVALAVNRLALTSLGGGPDFSRPQPVPLHVSAFDTTTTPPTLLAANPEFAVEPAEAGAVRNGSLQLDSTFLGPVRVIARQAGPNGALQAELFPNPDSLQSGLNVGQSLQPGAGIHRFHYTREVEVVCPDSLFPQGGLLRLFPHALARTFASLPTSALQNGLAYELSNPKGTALGDSVEIRLTPNAGFSGYAAIRRFDAAQLQWFEVTDTGSGAANGYGLPYAAARVGGLDGQYYGLFAASPPLGLADFEVIPNPFSPRVTAVRDGNNRPGARILFTPEADSSSEVTVTLRIYNLANEPVRTLINYQTYPKTPSEVYWDGRDDDGRRVRNGRYLLSAILTPTGGGKTRCLVKPIVVFE